MLHYHAAFLIPQKRKHDGSEDLADIHKHKKNKVTKR